MARQASPFYWIPCLLQCAISDCTLARNDEEEDMITIGKVSAPHLNIIGVQARALLTLK